MPEKRYNHGKTSSFIPYIQLHEIEGLLFSDSSFFSQYCSDEKTIKEFSEFVKKHENPELINDGAETHPSMRFTCFYKSYSKVSDLPVFLSSIGIETLLKRCPHFRAWIQTLTGLSGK
jgi:hypothetical protein